MKPDTENFLRQTLVCYVSKVTKTFRFIVLQVEPFCIDEKNICDVK